MSDDLTAEELHHAVDRAVEELLEKAGVSGPPVDALALARAALGMTVRVEEGHPKRRKAATGGDIVLRPGLSEEQRQWAVAQAIGGQFKPAILQRLGLSPGLNRGLSGESVANLFAVRLLLPTRWFGGDARWAGWDVAALHERYRTAGQEVIAWRLLDLPEPCVITVVDDGRVRRRRSNAWRINKKLSAPEQACQQFVHERNQAHVVRAGGWMVQGWPLGAAARGCEVLRSVADDIAPGEDTG
jgi:predicted transcriptional regulator